MGIDEEDDDDIEIDDGAREEIVDNSIFTIKNFSFFTCILF